MGAEAAGPAAPLAAVAAASADPAWPATRKSRPWPRADDEASPEPSTDEPVVQPHSRTLGRPGKPRRSGRKSNCTARSVARRLGFDSVPASGCGAFAHRQQGGRVPAPTARPPAGMLGAMSALTIRAAVLEAPGTEPRIEELTLDEPRAGEVLVRMAASGVCHSDLHVRRRRVAPAGPRSSWATRARASRGARAGGGRRSRRAWTSGGSSRWRGRRRAAAAGRASPVASGSARIPRRTATGCRTGRRAASGGGGGDVLTYCAIGTMASSQVVPGRGGDPDARRHAAGGRGAHRLLRGDGRRGGDEDAPGRARLERRGHRAGRRRAVGGHGRGARGCGADRRGRSRRGEARPGPGARRDRRRCSRATTRTRRPRRSATRPTAAPTSASRRSACRRRSRSRSAACRTAARRCSSG